MRQTKLPRITPENTPFVTVFRGLHCDWKATAQSTGDGFWVLLYCRKSKTRPPGFARQNQWYGNWIEVKQNIAFELSLIENGYYERLAQITEREGKNASHKT